MMARALNIVRMLTGWLRGFITDARRYRELSFDERHLFWKGVQSWVFVALMPFFLAMGAVWKALEARRSREGSR
jgi:hypothetical protein